MNFPRLISLVQRTVVLSVVVFSVVILGPLRAGAHAELDVQIAEVTRRIQKDSKSATLFLDRAELHRQHGDWTNALADYATAQKLSSGLAVVHRARGQMFYEAERPDEALAEVSLFLQSKPKDPEGLMLRGYTLLRLARPAEAAADFNESILANSAPEVGDYMARARALAAVGKHRFQEAIEGLDHGLKRFGASLLLQEIAIELEIKRGNYSEALRRLEASLGKVPRKEAFHTRRGELLERAGRPEEALLAYRSAIQCIEGLPSSRRNVQAIETLENAARAGLDRLTEASK